MATQERPRGKDETAKNAQKIIESLRADAKQLVNTTRATYGGVPVSDKGNVFSSVQEADRLQNKLYQEQAAQIRFEVNELCRRGRKIQERIGTRRRTV